VTRKKILISAGGTGGHLLPAQQLSLALRDRADLLFVGHGLERSPFFRRDLFAFHSMEAAPLRLARLFPFIQISCKSIWRSLALLRSYRPDLVIGFGSFHAFPVLAAAVLLRRKILLFEANCQFGKVNRLFARFADYTAAQFPLPGKVELVPLLPWREKVRIWDKTAALRKFGLEEGRKTCLIFGGSQGAAFLNRAIAQVLPANLQAIHLVGKEERIREVQDLYARVCIPACVLAYEEEMESAYAAADFAICRAGASTIAELIAHQLPALLIPYPYSTDDHQVANARFLAKNRGGAIMMLEQQATQTALVQAVHSLIEHADEYREKLGLYKEECEGRVGWSQRILEGE